MTRPISEVLQIIIPHAELVSSFYGGADRACDVGDITCEECGLAHRALKRAFLDKGQSGMSFTARKEMVKRQIKRCKENEGMPCR